MASNKMSDGRNVPSDPLSSAPSPSTEAEEWAPDSADTDLDATHELGAAPPAAPLFDEPPSSTSPDSAQGLSAASLLLEQSNQPPSVTESSLATDPHWSLSEAEPSPATLSEAARGPGGAPPTEPPSSPASPAAGLPDSSWAQAARAVVLTFLLGLASVVFLRLSFHSGWLVEFLQNNQLPMKARDHLLLQMLAGGVLTAGLSGAWIYWNRQSPSAIARLERLAWFLSPLILLPALPVFFAHEVWKENHQVLLPLVLFAGLLCEFFVTHALQHVPPSVHSFWARLKPDPSQFAKLPAFLYRHRYLLLVLTAALAYGAFMSFYTIRWHHRLGTAIFDLGINNNLFTGGLHGVFNHSPIIFPEDPSKYVANHVKVGLYIFLPIYALYPHPETLLSIQSVSLGLGALPLFLFARRRIPEWSACLLALCYLCYYPMHGANFYEMKEPPTAAAFILTTIWAMDAGKFKTGWVFFFLGMFMREDMPIPLAVIGAFFLLSGHRVRTGLSMAVIATSWFLILRFKIMTDAGAWWFPSMYKGLWSEPARGFHSVLKTLASNPTYVLQHIFVEKKFWYILHLMTPLLFVSARRWYLWAAFIPGAILTLLITDYNPPILFSFQYVMYWAPYLFITAALALHVLQKEDRARQARSSGVLSGIVLASLVLTYNYGAFPRRDHALTSGYHKITFSWNEEHQKNYEDVQALLRDIPAEASVAATERVGAHLSGRLLFYTLRRGTHGAEYLVAQESGLRLDKTREVLFQALDSGEYGVFKEYGIFIVFKKGADPAENERVISEWKLRPKSKKSTARKPSRSAPPPSARDDALTEERDENSVEN